MKKLFIYSPCAILIIVALSQIYLTQTSALLTPAKGGGFGMFSTVDKLTNRSIVIYASSELEKKRIAIDTESSFFNTTVNRQWEITKAFPTNKNLSKLVGLIKFFVPDESIIIEVRKCTFNSKEHTVSYELVNSIEFQVN